MQEIITIHDQQFEPYLRETEILQRICELGRQISEDYRDKNPLFLCVLTGAFIFTADLVRACDLPCEMTFVKLSSYQGLESTGTLTTKLGISTSLKDRHVIVVEDIVDTGNTLSQFLPQVQALGPTSLRVASLLVKPTVLNNKVEVDYIGFEIPPKFVIGYGLDYEEQGRQLRHIYQIIN